MVHALEYEQRCLQHLQPLGATTHQTAAAAHHGSDPGLGGASHTDHPELRAKLSCNRQPETADRMLTQIG